MKTGFVYLRPTKVIFVRAMGPYVDSTPAAWKRMFAWLDAERAHDYPRQGYGLARDNPHQVAAAECRYDACVELADGMEGRLPADFRVQTLPGGPYVRKRHIGNHDGIRDCLAMLRDHWVPAHGLAADPRRPLIAIYLNDPRHTPGDRLRTDLCLPITPISRALSGKAA